MDFQLNYSAMRACRAPTTQVRTGNRPLTFLPLPLLMFSTPPFELEESLVHSTPAMSLLSINAEIPLSPTTTDPLPLESPSYGYMRI